MLFYLVGWKFSRLSKRCIYLKIKKNCEKWIFANSRKKVHRGDFKNSKICQFIYFCFRNSITYSIRDLGSFNLYMNQIHELMNQIQRNKSILQSYYKIAVMILLHRMLHSDLHSCLLGSVYENYEIQNAHSPYIHTY